MKAADKGNPSIIPLVENDRADRELMRLSFQKTIPFHRLPSD
jgi:hypothetical protein